MEGFDLADRLPILPLSAAETAGRAVTTPAGKDTVDLRPTETVEVAVRFTDYPGGYMLHCHNSNMRTWR